MTDRDSLIEPMPDLGEFFITGVGIADGILTIAIESKISPIRRIEFGSHEAFQLFHESDYYPTFSQYELTPVTSVKEGDWGIFRVEKSPFYNLFRDANGRFLTEFPLCFLIATPDEHVEVISFQQPRFG